MAVDVGTDCESCEEEEGYNEPYPGGYNSEELEANRRATQEALAHYFKKKVQNNPKYKVKDMRQDLDDQSLNVSYSKMKRVKRLVLEKLEGSYIDDFNKLEAYAQKFRETNPGTDVMINISKEALEQEKKKIFKNICVVSSFEKWLEKRFEAIHRGPLDAVNQVLPKTHRSQLEQELEGYRDEEVTMMVCLNFKDQHNSPRCALLAPQASQNSGTVFMPNPGFVASSSQHISQQSIQQKSKPARPLKSKRNIKQPAAPSNLTKQSIAPLNAVVDEDEVEGELEDENEQPILRPKVISEARTRLQYKKMQQQTTDTRRICFKGDETGVSMPVSAILTKKVGLKRQSC
ncbi:hypothetical protein HAX54_002978 [Datura stramonium]|uniref:Uncharacterized protein n=1 Tax=Datura stramonium TaxID=4076 RepID=A0ABS8WWM7_DATST|nr:hypothetical protein [Datura stramonium]